MLIPSFVYSSIKETFQLCLGLSFLVPQNFLWLDFKRHFHIDAVFSALVAFAGIWPKPCLLFAIGPLLGRVRSMRSE